MVVMNSSPFPTLSPKLGRVNLKMWKIKYFVICYIYIYIFQQITTKWNIYI